MSKRSFIIVGVAVAAVFVLASWWGQGQGDRPASANTPAAQHESDLAITYRTNTDQTPPQQYSLSCEGAKPKLSASAPEGIDARESCSALTDIEPGDLDPIEPGQVCAMIYGGPQSAQIVGQLHGEEISVMLTRGDGCQIARWDQVRELLPDVPAPEALASPEQ